MLIRFLGAKPTPVPGKGRYALSIFLLLKRRRDGEDANEFELNYFYPRR